MQLYQTATVVSVEQDLSSLISKPYIPSCKEVMYSGLISFVKTKEVKVKYDVIAELSVTVVFYISSVPAIHFCPPSREKQGTRPWHAPKFTRSFTERQKPRGVR